MNEPNVSELSSPPRPLVLVVDDCADVRTLFGSRLRLAGYRVAFATSGEDALVEAHRLHPDAVVMDLDLEGMDGWTATRELRRDPETERVPIVVVSGHTAPEHVDRAYQSGCDRFVPKPCLPETLVGVLGGLLQQERTAASA